MRMVLLILFGILYKGTFRSRFENGQIASGLGQIGIAYFFASLIVIFSRSFRSCLIWLGAILAGTALLHFFFLFPDSGQETLPLKVVLMDTSTGCSFRENFMAEPLILKESCAAFPPQELPLCESSLDLYCSGIPRTITQKTSPGVVA